MALQFKNTQLKNSSVSFGGVAVSLGASDLTPAFDLADATGLPIGSGISGLGTGVAAFLASATSANFRSAVTDETGTGSLVFATSPTLVTPALGTPSALVLTNATALPAAQVAQGTMVSGMVLVAPALGTPATGDLTNCTFPTLNQSTTGNAGTATKIASITNSNIVQLAETQTLTNKTLTAPTLTTPALGTPSALVLTNATALPAAQVAQGTMASGMVLVAPALGTPASGTLTNCTALPAANISQGTMVTGMVLVAPALGTVASGTLSACITGTPSGDTNLANKAYVDSVAQGLDIKDSVKAATTANISLSGAQTIDGVGVLADDRVLVKDQSDASQNGIYLCKAGAWARTDDFAAGDDEAGAFTFVEQGTAAVDTGWVCTNNKGSAIVGTSDLVFSQFSGAGSITAGDALTKSGNTLNVAVDGSSIEVNADALRVKASGITNAMLAGSIEDNKMNQLTTADKVAGSAVQLGSSGGLLNSTGLKVDVDDTSVALTGGKVAVKDNGINLEQLGIRPAFQRADIVGGGTTTIALSNRVSSANFRNGGWIQVFRNGQRMDYLASGANENSEYSITDNGSTTTSVVAGAAFEDGDQVFISYMY